MKKAKKNNFEEEIIEIKQKINEIYLISDTHFYHKNVGKYCNRPKNWTELVINNWNKIIKKDDIVLHLGDFAFKGFDEVKNIRNKLNGNIYLIRGNHDRHSKVWYKKLNINAISPFYLKINGVEYYFSHRPIKDYKVNNIHGHWHNKCPFTYITENGIINFNLSVEVINYTPIKISEIIKWLKK